jgi:hypothetical protein
MPVRVVIAFVLALAISPVRCGAVERDYLQRGEEKPTDRVDSAYDTWIRRILARGWQKDVVLRTADRPAFYPEGVTGILRTSGGYAAFRVEPSMQVWEALGYGSTDPHHPKDQIKTVRPVFRQRPLKESVAARIAAMWRHILGDPHNYGKDPNMYLDTSTFTYYVAFAPGERITAHIVGWGPKTEQMILVTNALGDYAFEKKSEKNLLNVLSKAEKKLRI